MTFYVTDQKTVVVVMLLVGVFSALVYDVFTIKRTLIKTPLPLLILEDVLFCLVTGTVYIFAVFLTNYGYVRWFQFAAFLAGFGLYRLIFSYFVVKLSTTILRFAAKLALKAFLIITSPLVFLVSFLVKITLKIIRSVKAKSAEKKLRRFSAREIKRQWRLSTDGFDK